MSTTFEIASADRQCPPEVIQIYQRVFHEDPYHENPSESDVRAIWDENDIKILALKDGEIVGLCFAEHVLSHKQVMMIVASCRRYHLTNGQFYEFLEQNYEASIKHKMYLSELAVGSHHRNQKIAEALVLAMLVEMGKRGMTGAVLRTAKERSPSLPLFHKLGMKDFAVEQIHDNEQTASRERIWLGIELDQVI